MTSECEASCADNSMSNRGYEGAAAACGVRQRAVCGGNCHRPLDSQDLLDKVQGRGPLGTTQNLQDAERSSQDCMGYEAFDAVCERE